jgi:hypothetical protein
LQAALLHALQHALLHPLLAHLVVFVAGIEARALVSAEASPGAAVEELGLGVVREGAGSCGEVGVDEGVGAVHEGVVGQRESARGENK